MLRPWFSILVLLMSRAAFSSNSFENSLEVAVRLGYSTQVRAVLLISLLCHCAGPAIVNRPLLAA